jgi:uncharacterized protein
MCPVSAVEYEKIAMIELLSKVFKPDDLEAMERLAGIKSRSTGLSYDFYISQILEVLRTRHNAVVGDIPDHELRRIISIVDIVGVESHGLMKRLASACLGCGWCCAQTKSIHVFPDDVDRISRKLKRKKEDLFDLRAGQWFMKQANPCRWWNQRTGRCSIYSIRPRTCRDWPLAENLEHKHTLVAAADCHYSVGVMVFKVLGTLALARSDSSSPAP